MIFDYTSLFHKKHCKRMNTTPTNNMKTKEIIKSWNLSEDKKDLKQRNIYRFKWINFHNCCFCCCWVLVVCFVVAEKAFNSMKILN